MGVACDNAAVRDSGAAAPHLTPPSPAGWSFWRIAECRTAGFPLAAVLEFADQACAEAADRLVAAQEHESALWNELRGEVKTRIRELLAALRVTPAEQQEGAGLHRTIAALRLDAAEIDRRVLSARLLQRLSHATGARLRDGTAQRALASEQFGRSFDAATERASRAAARLAADDRFREAITWQTPSVVRTVLDFVLESGGGAGQRQRRSEELIASYAQRYCTKNDTIGFFGPVGWASFSGHGPAIHLQPAPSLLAARHVYFEDWAIRALAARLSAAHALRPWMTPRRMPFLRLEGMVLHLPDRTRLALTAEDAAILKACDGTLAAREIARALALNPFLDFDVETDVYAAMEALERQGRIGWGFVVRSSDARTENHLRMQLEAIAEPALRVPALAGLDALVSVRGELSAAAGDAAGTAEAMSRLGEAFERVTGTAAARRAGESYGARTIVYEDCVRDMRLDLGPGFVELLQPALDLILNSARWFCHQLARLVRERCRDILRALPAAMGDGAGPAPFPAFWFHAQALFFGATPLDTGPIEDELHRRWERIVGLDGGRHRVARSSDELREDVAGAFAAPDCGWRSACHQSPDIMLAARSAEREAIGDSWFVLGEIHLGLNTLINQSAVNQFPAPSQLLSMLAADRGQPRIIPLLSPDGTRQPIRVQTVTQAGYDMELLFSHDACPIAPERALAIGELVIEEADDGRLVVRTHDQRHRFDVLDVFGEFLSGFAAARFHPFAAAVHQPRISIDRLVVQRETWRFRYDELGLTTTADAGQRYLEVRRWRSAQGLPRHVFVKVPWEQKPFYVDFDSPLYVRMFVKQARKARDGGASAGTRITVSEMLPAHGDTWMRDGAGQQYTSELRIVAVHADDRMRHDGGAVTLAAPASPAGEPTSRTCALVE